MPLKYTEFPDLYSSTTPDSREDRTSSTSLELNVERRPDLVVAWAILLRCYTEETQPTFKVHGDDVRVDLSDLTSPSVKNVTGAEGFRYTGIWGIQAGFPDDWEAGRLIIVGTSTRRVRFTYTR